MEGRCGSLPVQQEVVSFLLLVPQSHRNPNLGTIGIASGFLLVAFFLSFLPSRDAS